MLVNFFREDHQDEAPLPPSLSSSLPPSHTPPRPHRTTHIQRIFRRIQPAVVMVCESMGAKVRNPNETYMA